MQSGQVHWVLAAVHEARASIAAEPCEIINYVPVPFSQQVRCQVIFILYQQNV
jgi:hypothetical protein